MNSNELGDRILHRIPYINSPTYNEAKMTRYVYIFLFIIFCLSLIFFQKASFGFKCASTFKTREEYMISLGSWIMAYLKKYPNATQDEIMEVRKKLNEEYRCVANSSMAGWFPEP